MSRSGGWRTHGPEGTASERRRHDERAPTGGAPEPSPAPPGRMPTRWRSGTSTWSSASRFSRRSRCCSECGAGEATRRSSRWRSSPPWPSPTSSSSSRPWPSSPADDHGLAGLGALAPLTPLPLEGQEQLLQQRSQGFPLLPVEDAEEPPLRLQEGGPNPAHQGAARAGELDERAAPVLGVGYPANEARPLQAMKLVGYCARSPHEAAVEIGRGEPVGRAAPPQAGEDVPAGPVDAEPGEGGLQLTVDVGDQSSKTGDHRHRAAVGSRLDALSLGDDAVDVVIRLLPRYLHVKIF